MRLDDDEKTLAFYNVTNCSTLKLVVRLIGSSQGPAVQTKKDDVKKGENASSKDEDSLDDACKKFQDNLNESRNAEVKTEVEVKTQTFKKLEERKIEHINEIAELETQQEEASIEFEERKKKAE